MNRENRKQTASSLLYAESTRNWFCNRKGLHMGRFNGIHVPQGLLWRQYVTKERQIQQVD